MRSEVRSEQDTGPLGKSARRRSSSNCLKENEIGAASGARSDLRISCSRQFGWANACGISWNHVGPNRYVNCDSVGEGAKRNRSSLRPVEKSIRNPVWPQVRRSTVRSCDLRRALLSLAGDTFPGIDEYFVPHARHGGTELPFPMGRRVSQAAWLRSDSRIRSFARPAVVLLIQ